MKQNTKKQPEKTGLKAAASVGIKREKSTVIVLAISAVVFIAALFWLHGDDILHGAGDIFWEYGDEIIEFEKAKVTSILREDLKLDTVAENSYTGTQELEVLMRSGRYKGEKMVAYNYTGPRSLSPVSVGDGVILTVKTHADGTHTATVYEYNRIPALVAFVLLFFVVTCLVGGRTGLKSLVGLVFTVICLFALLIPLLLKGAPTIFTTFVVCAFIAVVSFTVLGGIHRKTVSAFLGTVSGAFLAMIFGLIAQTMARLDGFRLEDSEPLYQLKLQGIPVSIRGLLVAGIIISALGAVMDVAMSISSSLEEVHAANPSLSRAELFRSGMNIGRDMAGTMTNTLILAFLGGEFTLTIFLYARGLAFYRLFSTPLVGLETISGISASLGLIMAIPLTAFISSALIARKGTSGKSKAKTGTPARRKS